MTNRLKPLHGVIIFVIILIYLIFISGYLTAALGVYSYIVGELILAAIALGAAYILKVNLKETFPTVLPPVRCFFGGLLLYGGTYLAMIPILILLLKLFPGISDSNEALNNVVLQTNPALSVLSVAIMPAICEEIVCRGFIMSSMKPLKNEALIIAVTGISFGILHLDLYRILPTAMLGAVFAYIAIKTKSIILPVIYHFINNLFSVISVYYLDSVSVETAAADTVTFETITMIGVSLFYVGITVLLLYFGRILLLKSKINVVSMAIMLVISASLLIGGILVTAISTLYNLPAL